jgi:L,D-peptidoglycan transpeptidase YkuD (ErfK/YbiS/YcfS/YnhG family)
MRRPVVGALLVIALAGSTAACSSNTASHRSSTRTWTVASQAEPLPLKLPTERARSVITITARSMGDTAAQAQAWVAMGDNKWERYGPRFVAHVANGGLTLHEHESLAATPIGSFTLTEAFGRLPNPGTALPYVQTTPEDWWISQPGALYNSHQRCQVSCPFTTGTPNAQLYYVAPQYNLAVVIDYNRRPAVQGLGSGIFLHVSTNRPTNGCVSVPAGDLVQLMRWLKPNDHPRILIGVAGM